MKSVRRDSQLWPLGAFLSAALLAIALAACGASGDGSRSDAYGESDPQTVTGSSVAVEMKDLRFVPQGIKVGVGTTVTWRNEDAVDHNVRQIQSEFLSPDVVEPGQSFTYTFGRPGTFRYQCTLHHPDMNGVVIVG